MTANSTSSPLPGAATADGCEAAGARRPLPELRLRHAIPFAIGGQLAYVLSQMGVLAALAHFRGPVAVGEFGLALALTTPAFMFVNMGGKSSQASDVAQKYSFAEYAGLGIAAAIAGVAVSIALGLMFASTPQTLLIVIVVALTKAVESVSSLSYGAFQQAGRVDKMALSMTLRGLFTVALFTLFLSLGFATGLAFLAQLIVWSALAFFRDYPLASTIADGRFVWPSRDVRRIGRLARETMPLGASYFVNSLLVSLPRLVVERSLGLSAVGLLTVVTYFQQAGTMLLTAMSQALVNRFAKLRQRDAGAAMRRTLRGLVIFAAAGSVIGLVVAVVAGEWLLTTLFGRPFGAASGLLVLIAIALCARLFGVIPQSLLHAERRFGTFLFREVATLVLCAAVLAYCVPRWGLMGAGYAIVAAAIFRLLIMVFATASRHGRRQPVRRLDPDMAPGTWS